MQRKRNLRNSHVWTANIHPAYEYCIGMTQNWFTGEPRPALLLCYQQYFERPLYPLERTITHVTLRMALSAAQRLCNITSHYWQRRKVGKNGISGNVKRFNYAPKRKSGDLNAQLMCPLTILSPDLQEVGSSCTQAPLAVPAPAPEAPQVAIRHSHHLHTPSPRLQRSLPSQRSGC